MSEYKSSVSYNMFFDDMAESLVGDMFLRSGAGIFRGVSCALHGELAFIRYTDLSCNEVILQVDIQAATGNPSVELAKRDWAAIDTLQNVIASSMKMKPPISSILHRVYLNLHEGECE